MMTPKNIKTFKKEDLKKIKGICFDIDDTFSTHGKILPEAYQSLWELKNNGILLVPVTGRPAGWCDHLIRFWPIDAIVGENGAFIYYLDKSSETSGRKKELIPPGGDLDRIDKLKTLQKNILKNFPEAKFASDQPFRVNDLAIDLCEDVEPWSSERAEELLNFCLKAGAHAKLSSIHVNTWFGEFDKLKGLKFWFESGMPGVEQSHPNREPLLKSQLGDESWMYFGDSPNDEPMFKAFINSIGVKNVEPYLLKMKSPPKWIANLEGGLGFSEVVKMILS